MSTFLHRVRGPTIGFSCLDLFVITNASISNVSQMSDALGKENDNVFATILPIDRLSPPSPPTSSSSPTSVDRRRLPMPPRSERRRLGQPRPSTSPPRRPLPLLDLRRTKKKEEDINSQHCKKRSCTKEGRKELIAGRGSYHLYTTTKFMHSTTQILWTLVLLS